MFVFEALERLMRRKALSFKQSDVSRACRGVQELGMDIGRVDVDPRTGVISVIPATQQAAPDRESVDEIVAKLK
jgi:hypothetical protein